LLNYYTSFVISPFVAFVVDPVKNIVLPPSDEPSALDTVIATGGSAVGGNETAAAEETEEAPEDTEQVSFVSHLYNSLGLFLLISKSSAIIPFCTECL
jgi:hypothetical protein